ncbi:MAG: response regulator transcription factor [Chloroflexi bacterium]|nr:response regulator transcription factor [Chloroflexota bacterium]
MTSAKILLINDEPNILRTLRRNLTSRGYEVSIALDDEETLSMISRTEFDLHILNLDFNTLDVDGLAICRRVREVSLAPIIVLSAVGSEKMKIEALDLGADDYLVMPFSMGEFLARARSALRRWATYQSGKPKRVNIIASNDLLIDMDARRVTVQGQEIHLTPTEYDLLEYLAKNEGKVITHRVLLQAVWGPEYSDEREYLRVFISQLRRKIEQDSLHPKHILTEPGVGYRFA